MDRRAVLKAAAGALAAGNGLAAPAIAQRTDLRTLRLVPHADLTNFDPTWSPAYIARNAGLIDYMSDDYDPAVDAKIAQMTPEQAFGYWCNWKGLVGWGDTLIRVLDGLRAASSDKVKP